MCDKIEAIESQLEEAINAINEINNDQIDSYHYMLVTIEDLKEEISNIKENYVAIEAIQPILNAIKNLTNEINNLKRDLKSILNEEKSKVTFGDPVATASTTPINNSKTHCGDHDECKCASTSSNTSWADIIKITYGKPNGTKYTIKKLIEDDDTNTWILF